MAAQPRCSNLPRALMQAEARRCRLTWDINCQLRALHAIWLPSAGLRKVAGGQLLPVAFLISLAHDSQVWPLDELQSRFGRELFGHALSPYSTLPAPRDRCTGSWGSWLLDVRHLTPRHGSPLNTLTGHILDLVRRPAVCELQPGNRPSQIASRNR